MHSHKLLETALNPFSTRVSLHQERQDCSAYSLLFFCFLLFWEKYSFQPLLAPRPQGVERLARNVMLTAQFTDLPIGPLMGYHRACQTHCSRRCATMTLLHWFLL